MLNRGFHTLFFVRTKQTKYNILTVDLKRCYYIHFVTVSGLYAKLGEPYI